MPFTFSEPRFGYDHPTNAVQVPCHVVGKLTPVSGVETVLSMGFSVDNGTVRDIVIPPSLHYGFRLQGGPEETIGNHFLTIAVIANSLQLSVYTIPFTTAGTATVRAEILAAADAAYDTAARNSLGIAGKEDRKLPDHRIELLAGEQQVTGQHVLRTLKMKFTPATGTRTPRVAVLCLFRPAKQTVTHSFFQTYDTPGDAESVPVVHPNVPGTLYRRVLLWDGADVQRGDLLSRILKQQTDTIEYRP